MNIWELIYCVGFLVAFLYGSKMFTDKRNTLDFSELLGVFFISAFSWVGLLALIIGFNIKHGHDDHDKFNLT